MTGERERRGAARVSMPGRIDGRVRATLDCHLLDLSTTGARIEHQNLLRPSFVCTLELPPTLGSLALSVRVVRSSVVGTEQTAAGERLLRYESGLAFLGITPEQQSALRSLLERFAAPSLGNGKLIF